MNHMRGELDVDVRYPSFPFWLHGAFLWLFGGLDRPEASLGIARVVNATVFGLFAAASYQLLRDIAPRRYALLGVSMLVTMPVVVSSAFLVKTENLLLLELVVALLALRRIEETPDSLRWHVVAAIAAGLGITTKLNPLPALLYLLQWVRLWRTQRAPALRRAGAFGLVFVAVILGTWTNLWIFDDIVRGWATDPYFQPNAAPFRAVDEWLAFPYGRYSSFFSVSVPLGLGWPLMGLFAAALALRTQDAWTRDVVGLGSLLYLVVSLHGTLLRVPFSFIVLFVYPILVVTSLGPRLGRWAVPIAAVCVLYGVWFFHDVQRLGDIEGALRARTRAVSNTAEPLLLVQPRSAEPDHRSIRARVDAERPVAIAVFSSYFANMCKYRENPLYRENCSYYEELLRGEAGYEVVDEIPYPCRAAACTSTPRFAMPPSTCCKDATVEAAGGSAHEGTTSRCASTSGRAA